jgi:hypothetical protein
LQSKAIEKQKATGSQYIYEGFVPAHLEGQRLTLIRYNAYLDQIEVKDATDNISTLVATEGVVISTTDKRQAYVFLPFTDENGERAFGYLNLLSDNANVKIYSRSRVYLQAEKESKSGYDSYRPESYKKGATKYFIKVGEKPIVNISKKKELMKLFPGKEKQIEGYFDNNKVSLSNDEDLQKLGVFLNSI